LKRKVQRGSHPQKKQLLLCLTELCEKSGIDDKIDVEESMLSQASRSEEWIKAIDRGRLIHVTCST